MTTPSRLIGNRLKALAQRFLPSRSRPSQALIDELLFLSTRTQSLDDLLNQLPGHVCAALGLTSFSIFVREPAGYVLKNSAATEAFVFPPSCSTISRMRRDRRPAVFVPAGTLNAQPDGWQLLAEPFELEALTALNAQLLLPLEGRTGLMGFAVLARPAAAAFTPAELRFLRNLDPEMGRGLEVAKLVTSISEQAVERARANRELELAREVQERLLPPRLPRLPGLNAAAAYRSAGQIGGDYYDLFTTPGGRVYGVIADVSGKGVPAALLMASLRATLHALTLQADLSLPRIVTHFNGLLYDASASSSYATLFVFTWSREDQSISYVNAGHNPPFLFRADKSSTRLTAGGPVVGLLRQASYESATIPTAPGDLLVAYTDGVTEATDAHGLEWGETALQSTIQHCLQMDARSSEGTVHEILRNLDAFTAGSTQGDDITILVCTLHEEHFERIAATNT